MLNLVYKMVRVLFLVLVEKNLIGKADIESMKGLIKKYENKRIDSQVSDFESKYRMDNINKDISKSIKKFKKIGKSSSND